MFTLLEYTNLFSTAAENLLNQITFPKNDFESRIEWAGERAWDIAEGLVSDDVAQLIITTIIGWTDLCSDEERTAYKTIAGQIINILKSR